MVEMVGCCAFIFIKHLKFHDVLIQFKCSWSKLIHWLIDWLMSINQVFCRGCWCINGSRLKSSTTNKLARRQRSFHWSTVNLASYWLDCDNVVAQKKFHEQPECERKSSEGQITRFEPEINKFCSLIDLPHCWIKTGRYLHIRLFSTVRICWTRSWKTSFNNLIVSWRRVSIT